MHLQLALIKGSRAQRFIIRKKETVIGRQRGCHLRIPISEISRRHCIICIENGVVTVEDLNSANGTFINEERIDGKVVVQPGDQIRLGSVVFVAEYQMSDPTQVEPSLSQDDVDVERVLPARAITDDADEEVEVVDDGMPPFARPLALPEKEEAAEPLAVDSTDMLAPLPPPKEETLFPGSKPKKAKPVKEPVEEPDVQVPLPEASSGLGDNVMKGWKMPVGGDFSALLDGILEGEKEHQEKEKEEQEESD